MRSRRASSVSSAVLVVMAGTACCSTAPLQHMKRGTSREKDMRDSEPQHMNVVLMCCHLVPHSIPFAVASHRYPAPKTCEGRYLW